MQTVVGVRFKRAGKIYYFDPNDIELKPGDHVIVETARGIEYGEIVVPPKEVPEEDIVPPLKKVIRKATEEDELKVKENKEKESKAFEICLREIAKHKLPMKLVGVEYTFDNNKLIFYFTAEGRVDFRELVRDLAAIFRTRIELRQIGVRDEAKMIGGLGPCGRNMCCCTFLGDFQPVSIRMAKEQKLSLNPAKISGVCGRLMCCLKFEQDFYEDVLKRMPKVNKEVLTPDGKGIVVDINVLFEKVKVKLVQEDGTVAVKEYSPDEVELIDKDQGEEVLEEADDMQDDLNGMDEEIRSLMDE
ncbi:MAG: stage 0 sporulation family protein [Caldicoprobacter oshimai]|uniref:PSP1 domain-containing protein n=1 Tax=Caldicoprobacter faecalis TaxID=937334 RepID=UPI0004722C9B|nr:stage 0 sporulation family protein [Caldicoprobacter faecalis]PZN11505.1 MAG: stage 0 sporulation protein [Caldicoprobacter oshimai]